MPVRWSSTPLASLSTSGCLFAGHQPHCHLRITDFGYGRVQSTDTLRAPVIRSASFMATEAAALTSVLHAPCLALCPGLLPESMAPLGILVVLPLGVGTPFTLKLTLLMMPSC